MSVSSLLRRRPPGKRWGTSAATLAWEGPPRAGVTGPVCSLSPLGPGDNVHRFRSLSTAHWLPGATWRWPGQLGDLEATRD